MANKDIVKTLCAIDFIKGTDIGGPTINNNRIIHSKLNEYIKFVPVYHDMSFGRGISLRRILDLRNQLKKIKPDILLFSGVQLAAFHILIASILAGQKSRFMIIRGFSFDALDISIFKRFLLGFFIEPLCFVMCTKFVGNSFFSANRLVSKIFWWKNKGYIHNLLPAKEHIPIEKLEMLKSELNISNNKIIISSVGRITVDKGYKLLAEAILHLSKSRSDFIFIISGDGNYMQEFKSFIKQNKLETYVKLLGKRSDINELNLISEIFVLPSLHETLSSALMEASMSSCALVATETGGIVEIVKNGFNGYTFQIGNKEQLIEKIEILLEDEVLRAQMGKNALNFIDNNFSNEDLEDKLKNFCIDR